MTPELSEADDAADLDRSVCRHNLAAGEPTLPFDPGAFNPQHATLPHVALMQCGSSATSSLATASYNRSRHQDYLFPAF